MHFSDLVYRGPVQFAYGKLVSLNSAWLDEVQSIREKDQATISDLQHLMITFDDGPCYEIICRSWSINE